MKKPRPFLLIPLLSMSCILLPIVIHAQLITQGGLGSIYQQMDNSAGNTNLWTRSVGIGYFTPNGIVPESFLHINTEFSLLPQNGSIVGLSETFRTTVEGGQNQQWRMERGEREIGRLYHTNPNRSFRIRVVQPQGGAGGIEVAHLFLENAYDDGIKISQNSEAAFPEMLNAFPLLRTGYVASGVRDGGYNALSPAGPWSRYHIAHSDQGANPPNFAFRPQMRNGITLTGNSSLSYLGQWFDQGTSGTDPEVDDNSNLVIATSDDALPAGFGHHWDHISFRFMGDMAASQGSASGVEGLEMMRIRPFRPTVNDPIEGFLGVGDFLSAATGPEERLDILDGRVRIRQLPNDPEMDTENRFVVADINGVLGWRNVPGGPLGCEWDQWSTADHLRTAWAGADPDCPDEDSRVGIGLGTVPGAKLHVYREVDSGSEIAGLFEIEGDDGDKWAVRGSASGTGDTHIGVRGFALNAAVNNSGVLGIVEMESGNTVSTNRGVQGNALLKAGSTATNNYGVEAIATVVGTTGTNYGVRSFAQVTGSATDNYGVYSLASGAGAATGYGIWARSLNATTDNWAAFFAGKVWIGGVGFVNGGTAITSDANLKINVEELENSVDRVMQLQPKTYVHDTAAYPHMNLDPDNQIGLIAQQVESVVPEAVKSTIYPVQYDEEGNALNEAMPVKGVVYSTLVPLLIGAIQEQQAQLAEQASRLDQLEAQLGDCCSQMIQGGDLRGMEPAGPAPGERLLTIVPNPVSEFTAIGYTLGRGGRVMLLLTGSDGRQMQVLHEAHLEAGSYQHDWHTAQLAAGMYHITLLLDGEPLVKRAVKL